MQVDKTASGVASAYLFFFGTTKELTALTPPMGGVRGESGGVTTEGESEGARRNINVFLSCVFNFMIYLMCWIWFMNFIYAIHLMCWSGLTLR